VTLLGLPLIDVARARPGSAPRAVAVGWIAVGPVACGVLLAVGGVAIGGVGIGGLGIGLVAVAGLALGIAPVGGLAVGMFAFGGVALGLTAAMGGLAVARDLALGGIATAAHANDNVAREYFQTNPYFHSVELFMTYRWILAVVIVPVIIFRALRRKTVVSHQPPTTNH
jgi:hypothetical protein